MLFHLEHPLCTIVSYADDTNIVIKCKNISDAEDSTIGLKKTNYA